MSEAATCLSIPGDSSRHAQRAHMPQRACSSWQVFWKRCCQRGSEPLSVHPKMCVWHSAWIIGGGEEKRVSKWTWKVGRFQRRGPALRLAAHQGPDIPVSPPHLQRPLPTLTAWLWRG